MKKISILFLITCIALFSLTGCTENNPSEIAEKEQAVQITPVVEENSKPNSESVKSDFIKLIENEKDSGLIVEYLDKYKTEVTKEDMSEMVLRYAKILRDKWLLDYNDEMDKITNVSENYKVVSQIYDYINSDRDINKIRNQEVRNFIMKSNKIGLTVDVSEGFCFLVIDYKFILDNYSNFIDEDYIEYLSFMYNAVNKPASDDASIIISWDELAERIIDTEKLLKKESIYIDKDVVKDFNLFYMFAYVNGQPNTPIYDYETEDMLEEVLISYKNSIEKYKGSELEKLLVEYVSILENNGFKYVYYEDNKELNDLLTRYDIKGFIGD